MKAGDKVHIATKQHQTFDNATVIGNDHVTLVIRTVDGEHGQFEEVHALLWDNIMYCYEQAQWDLEQSLMQEEEDNDDG